MNTEPAVNSLSFHVPDRILDDDSLCFDLPKIIQNIKQEETYTSGQRNAITLTKSNCMRVVLIALHAKSEINFHHSGDVICIQLIEGKINYQADEKSGILEPSCLLLIHDFVGHTLLALEDTILLLTFTF